MIDEAGVYFMKIILTKQEQLDLEEFIKWKVQKPCLKCKQSEPCNYDCSDYKEWNQAISNRRDFGHALYNRPALLQYCKAFEEMQTLRLEQDEITEQYIKAIDEYKALFENDYEIAKDEPKSNTESNTPQPGCINCTDAPIYRGMPEYDD